MYLTLHVIKVWISNEYRWGPKWGMNGFYKLKRGVNLCSVNVDAMYPVLKTPTSRVIKPINTPTDCKYIDDVYSLSGVYLKSLCIDKYSRNYESSDMNCVLRGMQFYKLDTVEAKTKILDIATKTWYEKWLVQELHIAADATGNLLVSDKQPWGPYKIIKGNSSQNLLSVCEYIDTNRLNTFTSK
jgi:Papain family cysteine protease